MPSVNVYLDEEPYEMKKKIPKGKFSKIVQNAIKEHFGRDLDPEIIEEKLRELRIKLKKMKMKKIFGKKAESMCIVEKEKLEIEKKIWKYLWKKREKKKKRKK